MRFVRFSYYKTTNRTVPCYVVWCGALLLAVRYSYAILRMILVRFMQFGEHPPLCVLALGTAYID